MTTKTPRLALAAVLVAVSAGADKKKDADAWLDTPWVIASSTTENTKLSIQCVEPVKTRPRTIRCTSAMTMVHTPNVSQSLEALKYYEQLKPADLLKAACEKRATVPKPAAGATADQAAAAYKQVADGIEAACKAKDASAILGAIRWGSNEIDAKTCKIDTFALPEYELTQLDANTWQSTVAGICATTLVTIWRKPGELWNYRQVSNALPNRPSPACDNVGRTPESAVSDFRWNAARTRALGCVYLDL